MPPKTDTLNSPQVLGESHQAHSSAVDILKSWGFSVLISRFHLPCLEVAEMALDPPATPNLDHQPEEDRSVGRDACLVSICVTCFKRHQNATALVAIKQIL